MTEPAYPYNVSEYRLNLNVDFARLAWSGSVEFDVVGDGPAVPLDSVGLEIDRATVGGSPAPWTFHPEDEQVTLEAPVHGRARVVVDFHGTVKDGLMGLYKSRFGSSYILTTQCEPTGARMIFPCVDRPDRKARFHVTVEADANVDVVFNTPADGVTAAGARRRWSFATTPPMATYLFYLGVGRFERRSENAGSVSISVLTPPGRSGEGQTALEVARRSLSALERYYRLPYPLPKLDLIAVPEFPFGAMENWGAITFRELQLLIGPKTPAGEMRYTFHTIAHEVAHQWFGNLVTPYWWTDIWLNESFATFLEHVIIDQEYPELHSPEDFLLYWFRRGTMLDSLPSTHPIIVPVARPAEISEAVDLISYTKGASVLRMIEGYLGRERFQAGIADYLGRHAWGNARSTDLWEALDRTSGEPISTILKAWTERPGLPVVRATSTAEGITLAQERFSYDRRPNRETWPIPMVVAVNDRTERILFDSPSRQLSVPNGATVHLNQGASGFYRTLYDGPLYDRLLSTFSARSFGDRFVLFDDAYAFLLSGDLDFDRFRAFVNASLDATDFPLVSTATGALAQLYHWAGHLPEVADLARTFLARQADRLGIEPRPGESTSDGALRETVAIARVEADFGYARTLSELFPSWERIDPNVRAAVARARSRVEGSRGFQELKTALGRNPPESEALSLEVAMAANSDVDRVRDALGLALSGVMNRGHMYRVVIEAAANPVARPVAWPWVAEHMDEINEKLRGTSMLAELLRLSLPLLGLAHGPAVKQFFRERDYPEAKRGIANGLATLEVAERLVARLEARAKGPARNRSGPAR